MEEIRFIQQFANPILDQLFVALTILGEESTFLAIFTIMFWCVDKQFSYKLGLAYLLSAVINIGIKETFRIPRPFGEEGIRYLRVETATGHSFPSGHTQSAAAYITSLILEYRKKWLTAGGLVLIVLVALSRLYVGAHRLNEVIVGALLGIGWIFVYNHYYGYIQKISKVQVLAGLLVVTVGGMLILKDPDWYKTSGVILSLVAGSFLEAKYVGFDVRARLPQQFGKMIIGLAVALLIKGGLKLLFPEALFWHFIRYVCLGLWVTVGAPALFKTIFADTRPVSQLEV